MIILLTPLALKGVRFKNLSDQKVLFQNLTFYGLTGLIAPILGIKLIDMSLAPLFLVLQ
jgi:K+-transporting ATPase ATPase B chain